MTKYAVYAAITESGRFLRAGRYLAASEKAAAATLASFPEGTQIIHICDVYTVAEAMGMVEKLNLIKSSPPSQRPAADESPRVVKSNSSTRVVRSKAVFGE